MKKDKGAKVVKKNNLINIFIVIITILSLSNIVFAENKVNSNSTNLENNINASSTNSVNAIKTNTNNVTNNTTAKTNSKSSNANLSNLGIKPNDFSGFSENKTSYSVTVPNTVTEVEVYATKKDRKASLTGTGTKKLQEGENIANVVVTAEDGTTKTYTINIKRLAKNEKEVDTKNTESTNTSSEIGLSKLEIEGASLEPEFNNQVYKYEVNIKGEQTKLAITANTSNSNEDVEIIGNENLLNGQNIITILVTNTKSGSVATYQIFVNKNVLDQETVNKELQETENAIQLKFWIVRILIIIIVVGIIAILILRHKKQNEKYYEDDEEDYNENALPKGLRNLNEESIKKMITEYNENNTVQIKSKKFDDNKLIKNKLSQYDDNIVIQECEKKEKLEDKHIQTRRNHYKGRRFK